MRVYKLKAFTRFQRKERLGDEALCEAVARAEAGLIDAGLGNGLIKQRVARPGRGRSGGYRTLIAYREEERAVFLYGFAKSDRENVDTGEIAAWGQLGRRFLALDDDAIEAASIDGDLKEIECAENEG